VTQVHKLLHGKEPTICGDSSADKREELQHVDAGLLDCRKAIEAVRDEDPTGTPRCQALGAVQGQPAGQA
jgi:hypothetical protein